MDGRRRTHSETMEQMKIDDDDEYVKVEKEDADMEFVKVDKVDADNESEEIDDDVESEEAENADDQLESEEGDDDVDSEEVDDDVECKMGDINYFIPFSPPPKWKGVVEIKDLVRDNVLPFLPAKAIVRFMSVSKEWGQWIKNPFLAHRQSYYFKDLSGFFCQFSKANHGFVTLDSSACGVPKPHLRSFLPEDVKLLSSCSGLLLCHGLDDHNQYYVCNPATQEWTHLPRPTLYHGHESATVLAFEPSPLNMEANYQLLCMIPSADHVYFELYSSATNSWKESETILIFTEETSIKDNGFYMNGIAYMEISTRKVIAFHLSYEMYEVISLPSESPPDGVLTQIQGELCYIGVSRSFAHEFSIKIYAGMDLCLKYQVDANFAADSIHGFPRYRVLPCLDGDNVMILIEGNMIYSCSRSDRSFKVAAEVPFGRFDTPVKYLPYVNSLVQVAKPRSLDNKNTVNS